jgi:hypothetical protein
VCTFSYFSLSRRHTFSISIPLQKQPFPSYPEHPLTIGEHIRKKRMDLGLLQREVAEIIGVTESSVWNWEHTLLTGKKCVLIFFSENHLPKGGNPHGNLGCIQGTGQSEKRNR